MKNNTTRLAISLLVATSPAGAAPLVYDLDPAKVERTTDVGIHGQFLEHIFNSVHGGLWGDLLLNPSLEPNGGGGGWLLKDDTVTLARPATNQPMLLGDPAWTDYEVTLEARRDEGSEGFLVMFRAAGDQHYRVNFGGWANKEHGIEKNGGPVRGARVPGSIEVGRWYHVKIICKAAGFKVFLDGKSVLSFEDRQNPLLRGCIGLNTWHTRSSFRNIKVTDADGNVMMSGLPTKEDLVNAPPYWTKTGAKNGWLGAQTESAFNDATSQMLNCTRPGGEFGLRQTPVNLTKNETYHGSLWLRSATGAAVVARLRDPAGAALFEQTFGNLSPEWTRHEFAYTPSADSPEAAFEIVVKGEGSAEVDMVHLFAQSALDVGGMRPDVLRAITDLKPASIRYPGGCFASAYRWKDGIGPRDQRRYFPNVIWADRDPSQFGTDEFIDLCRRSGAEPIIAINMNRGVEEALDWLEYCNGAADTRWGKVRAANGHPEPYAVKYWEIDNETWGMGPERYADFVRRFAPALKAKDPSIVIAACGSYGYDDGKGSSNGWNRKLLDAAAKDIDLLSIHYYNGIAYPQDHVEDPRRFEAFIRDDIGAMIRASANPKMRVYCSEWGQMNIEWRSGLYTAGLLSGFERIGGELLPMACPAVWLQSVRSRSNPAPRWGSSHILFDHRSWCAAPTYVVQKLWREHFGPQILYLTGPERPLDVVASSSGDGRTLFFKTVNTTDQACEVELRVGAGFKPAAAVLKVIAPGSLGTRNSLDQPDRIAPRAGEVAISGGTLRFSVPPQSACALSVK
jgi:alpha-N-arabinofuranosidase